MTDTMIIEIEDELMARLQARAIRNGRSLNDEVLAILRAALMGDEDPAGSKA